LAGHVVAAVYFLNSSLAFGIRAKLHVLAFSPLFIFFVGFVFTVFSEKTKIFLVLELKALLTEFHLAIDALIVVSSNFRNVRTFKTVTVLAPFYVWILVLLVNCF
jgi:hypothetical protein